MIFLCRKRFLTNCSSLTPCSRHWTDSESWQNFGWFTVNSINLRGQRSKAKNSPCRTFVAQHIMTSQDLNLHWPQTSLASWPQTSMRHYIWIRMASNETLETKLTSISLKNPKIEVAYFGNPDYTVVRTWSFTILVTVRMGHTDSETLLLLSTISLLQVMTSYIFKRP